MNQIQPEVLLSEFLNHLKVQDGLSDNTISSYRNQLKGYLGFLINFNRVMDEVKPSDIHGFLESKIAAGCKSSSRFISTIAIKKFHRYLCTRGLCETDPSKDIGLPKVRQQIPDPLSIEEIEKLFDLSAGSRFSLIRLRAMLECLYSTGVRVSELINLKLPGIELDGNWIRVLGKGDKTRDVPIGPRVREALRSYMAVRGTRFGSINDFVFLNSRGGRLTRGGFWKQLKQLGRRAMIAGRVFPHRVRHSTACHLLTNGVDLRVLQELLGHVSITTTQRYAHVTPAFLKAKVESAHPRF